MNGPIKTNCRLLCETPIAPMNRVYEMWGQHPLFNAAMEDLMIYERWVTRVVLPIAFQWIEEHKPEVYCNVPEEGYDDVGVVIAAAFEIVKTLPAYLEGQKVSGDISPAKCNRIWAPISQKIHDETRNAFNTHSDLLKETTCLPTNDEQSS